MSSLYLQGFVIDRKSNKLDLNIISPKIRVADDLFITNAMVKPMKTFCDKIIVFFYFFLKLKKEENRKCRRYKTKGI